jgi:hypothetical protein
MSASVGLRGRVEGMLAARPKGRDQRSARLITKGGVAAWPLPQL